MKVRFLLGLLTMNTINLQESGLSKFILLEDEDGSLTLTTNPNAEFHMDILKYEMKKTGKTYKRCLGGGRIRITDEEIHAYGYSVDYGKPPQDLVEQLLTEAANGKSVKVEIGKGY